MATTLAALMWTNMRNGTFDARSRQPIHLTKQFFQHLEGL